jgi:hypothetical protein
MRGGRIVIQLLGLLLGAGVYLVAAILLAAAALIARRRG